MFLKHSGARFQKFAGTPGKLQMQQILGIFNVVLMASCFLFLSLSKFPERETVKGRVNSYIDITWQNESCHNILSKFIPHPVEKNKITGVRQQTGISHNRKMDNRTASFLVWLCTLLILLAVYCVCSCTFMRLLTAWLWPSHYKQRLLRGGSGNSKSHLIFLTGVSSKL